jgi:hypothetical protein
MGGNLPIKKCFHLALIAKTVKALVVLYVSKEGGGVSAASGACGASSGGGVEVRVFAVERCIREGQIEIGLYPCGEVLRG